MAFEKYDGTNLHWDWDRDVGWHASGTRGDEFNLTAEGVAGFVRRHAHLQQSVAVFRAALADGLEKVFRDHPSYARFQGVKAFTEFFRPNWFAKAVRLGTYGVAEGVVCKGGTGGPDVWMVKIKTYAYLERLKQAFADRWDEYWE